MYIVLTCPIGAPSGLQRAACNHSEGRIEMAAMDENAAEVARILKGLEPKKVSVDEYGRIVIIDPDAVEKLKSLPSKPDNERLNAGCANFLGCF
jgi:hypothetical protein